jgi:hypothetical protein
MKAALRGTQKTNVFEQTSPGVRITSCSASSASSCYASDNRTRPQQTAGKARLGIGSTEPFPSLAVPPVLK